jgi:uncharacterized protein (TIGR02147 family)
MIFEYSDYRSYLKGVLADKIKKNPKYSLRAMAKHLTISPGQLSMVLQGKKRISQESTLQIASRLELNERESDYFSNLVHLDKAKTQKTKDFIIRKIEHIHPNQKVHSLQMDVFRMMSDWRHVAVLEMIDLDNFKSDSAWIAKRLEISQPEVNVIIDRLERLKLIKKENNILIKTNDFLAAKSEERNESLRDYHRQILKKGIDNLETQAPDKLEMASITMSIDVSKIKEAKNRMREFRTQMANFLTKGKKTQTYVLSTHLFNLTTGETKND